jgi:hypothetical protein
MSHVNWDRSLFFIGSRQTVEMTAHYFFMVTCKKNKINEFECYKLEYAVGFLLKSVKLF